MSISQTNLEQMVAALVKAKTEQLEKTIVGLQSEIQSLTLTTSVEQYKRQNIDEAINCNETLDIIKSLPEFNGRHYVSWREAVNNSMTLYKIGSRKYFAALTILRNKIIGDANDILTNHGTVLNLDAILSRLDFAYADKRPLHVLDQEMSVLRQGTLTVTEYYDTVNEKLTLLINKTIMTHGNESEVTRELNRNHRSTALRVFVTGLNQPLSNMLFASKPSDLPNALAQAQEIESNRIRVQFSTQFAQAQRHPLVQHSRQNFDNNLRFPRRNRNARNQYGQRNERPLPMEVDSSIQMRQSTQHRPQPRPTQQHHFQTQFPQQQRNFNVGNNNAMKRERAPPTSQQMPFKSQRVNNLNEESFLEIGPISPSSFNETNEDDLLES